MTDISTKKLKDALRVHQFRRWAKKMDPRKEYDYMSSAVCPIAQFVTDTFDLHNKQVFVTERTVHVWGLSRNLPLLASVDIPKRIRAAAQAGYPAGRGGQWTYGALVKRLQAWRVK